MTTPGFDHPYPAALQQISPTNWELLTPVIYHGNDQTFTVPAGYVTDLASVPAPLRALFPSYGAYTCSAVLHDYCWDLAETGQIAYRDADGLLRQSMRTLGVGFTRRWLMWAAVRWGSLVTRRNGWRGWIHDAPRVLAISLLALPLALPAGLGALPGLIVLWIADQVR